MTNAADAWGDELRVPEWTFADKLRKARQTVHAQQRTFAEKLGCSPAAYAQWEAGNSRPRDIVPLALRIEAVTKVPAWWILGMPDPSTPMQAPRPGGVVGPAGVEPTTSTVEFRYFEDLEPDGEHAVPPLILLDLERRARTKNEHNGPGCEPIPLFG